MISPDKSRVYLHRPKTGGTTTTAVLKRAGWVSHPPGHMTLDEASALCPRAEIIVTTRPDAEWLDSWLGHCWRAIDEARALGRVNERTEAALRWYGRGSLEREDVLAGARNVWGVYADRGAFPLGYDALLRPWRGEAPPCATLAACSRYLWEWGADRLLPLADLDELGDAMFGLEPGSFAEVGRLNVGRETQVDAGSLAGGRAG